MTKDASAVLRERLARLDADQITRLVTGLQQRIDDLRATQPPAQAPQIAIVGLACRFPGAPDAAAFRRLLAEGRNAVGPVPAGRPEGAALPPGGYIDDIDRYDAAFFGMRDSEAAHMDPQHRLMLEVAWHALEDAGAADPQRRARATGVFLGISTHDYELRFHGPGPGFTPLATTGNAASAAAGRLAHLLDITGPALSLDTACSSSLVAVHAACRSLRLGECDMAIAGGVNLLVGDDLTRGFAAAGMLSPSHACRTFDASADGYVRGEGAGFVVLKRLADARRDGDRIRAVVRGGAVNHDGRASSLTAPNASAQVALVRAALADAGLQPADVQVVECHGTGTPLGDPIEVQALAESYGAGRSEPLLLGAVKTNIGHLEAAAGIAGLIKLVLSLESGTLAPTLHQSSPNPRIAWERLPLHVIDRAQDWPGSAPRRAGVSSFGFSGTNAHLILEAAEVSGAVGGHASGPVEDGPVVLPLAAPDEQGLQRLAARLAAWLEESGTDLRRAAASMALGRSHHAVRAAAVAADAPAMAAALGEIAAGGAPAGGARGNAAKTAPRIAFLFTGQGSQWLGMGRDLYEADAVFRAAVDRCAQVVDPLIGRSLAAAMFYEGPAEDLADTRLAQPALFALEYALAERLAAWGVEPDVSIGHSLGEWVAACRAEVFSLDDALRLVVERGRVMGSAAEGGAMAAVFAGPQALDRLPADLRAGIDLAAVNAPDECVVSGPVDAVEAACAALDGQGVGTQRLRTTQAFHSRLMEPALGAFAAALEGVRLAAPARAVVSNLTGTAQAAFATTDYWVRHIREPVRFAQGMAAVADAGATVLIEIGASPALTGTASRCPGFEGRGAVFLATLRRNQPARRTLATLLGQLFVAGVPLRWDAVFGSGPRIDVPGYPFADRRHWLAAAAWIDAGAAAHALPGLAQATAAPGSRPADSAAGAAVAAVATSAAAAVQAAQAGSQPQAPAQPDVDPRQQIAAMLARSLQLSEADAQSDRSFLELGVDSLALTEAVAALERRWSIAIPRRALFETLATPLRLTEHVLQAGAQATGSASSAAAPPAAHAAPAGAATGGASVSAAVAASSSAAMAPQIIAATVPVVSASASQAAGATAAVASTAAQPALPSMSPQALAGLESFSRAYIQRSHASRGQRLEFGPYLADSRAVAGFRPETKGMLYPIVGAQAAGSHLTDIDGNRYVDIAMGFGVQLFGHSPAFITEAIARHIAERGMFIGPQAHLAGEVAQRICRLTGNERAAFCNSGTEAVMSALRLARHATGRQRIAMFQGSYHGHFDGTLAQVGPGGASVPLAGGTPPAMVGDVLLLDYGDEQGSLEIVAREAPSLAAVIVEPVQGRRPDRQPREFLQRLRAITQALGVPLIFDEVLLGFRVGLGGAQAWAGVRADLVTYGKIVGGGLPIGVVAGQARYLDALDGGAWPLDGPGAPRDARTFFAGTFNKNPLAMAAARSVLEYLEAEGPGLQEALNRRTADFAARLNAVLAQEQAGISVHHFASLFRFIGASDLFYNQMIQHGVYVWEGRTCFLSTAHSDADLDLVERAVRDSVRDMRAAGMLGGAPAPAPASASTAASVSVAPADTAAAQGLASASVAAHAAEGILPTTAGQQALRLLAAFSPQTSAAYNQSLVLDFKGALDAAALEAALHEVVRRHEALRTTFPEDGASQAVHRELAPRVLVLDRENADDEALQAWMSQAVLAPFDLERGPLVAAWLLRLAADRHRLVLAMPHLVTDGWSMQAMALELAELYSAAREGRAADLPEPVPYRRYAEHTRARAELPETAAYWRGVYATVPQALDLPADRPRPALQGYAGARAVRRLPAQLKQALEAYGRRAGGSLFAVCLAAYGRMLARLSGQDDLAVAIFSAGQAELGAPALLGYCVGVLPLRIAAGAGVADAALLAAVQRGVAQGMAHRDYPYARLLKDLNLRRDPSRPPLASVSFNLDRMEAPLRFAGLEVAVDANAHGAVRWDLNWNMTAGADGLCIEAHYNRDLFDAARVEQWLDLYAGMLEALTLPPGSGQSGVRAATVGSSAPVAATTASTATAAPTAATVAAAATAATASATAAAAGVETLAQRVSLHAAQTPGAAAVRDAHGIVGYAELDAMAQALAARLAEAGVHAGDRVAFRLPRGLGPVVAILAAMRLGAAFVPLDEDHPDSHHAYVLEDSGARALVVEAGAATPLARVPAVAWERGSGVRAASAPPQSASLSSQSVSLSPQSTAPSPWSAVVPSPQPAAAADIAYVLYTSGSTGRPKGVLVSQGAVAAYVQAMLGRLGLDGPLSCAIVSSFAADLGYTSVLGALWSGGALHAVDAETARDPAALQQWMAQTPVDVMKIVPPHLAALLDAPGAAALLPRKALLLGGDVLSWKLVDRIRGLGAACRIFNHYGPTETTVGACMIEAAASLRAEGEHAVPIGLPLDGYGVALAGADGAPVAEGAEGEIVISGPAVASGYTRPEAAGAERFGRDARGLRFYRTGDLGRRRPDGAIVFLGRGDDMVKIRGHRIEPAGLAELLRSCPGVRDAAVLVERHEGREPSLLAVVAGEAESAAVLAWLAEQVPAAMVPARIMVRAAMPLTPNGKIDRQALLAAAPREAVSAAAAAASGAMRSRDNAASSGAAQPSVSAIEGSAAQAPAGAGAASGGQADGRLVALLQIWRAVLQHDEVGPDDDFFALGGDSIMAIQIVGRARAAGLALAPTQVFQAPTPRGLAALAVSAVAGVAGAEPLLGPVPLTPIQHWLRETVMPDRNRWCLSAVFQAPYAVDASALQAVVEAMVARHDALRTAVDLDSSPACQQVRAAASPLLCMRDASALGAAELSDAQDRLADELMDAIDLAAGRVLAAGALSLGAGRGTQIVLAVHHAVSDMVSWSVLAEDLEAGLAGGPSALRAAGTSWSWWAQALSQRVRAEEAFLPYWAQTLRHADGAARIPVDDAARPNHEGDVRERRLCVPAEQAARFLAGMASVFGLRAHEAVLAATGLALAEWAAGALVLDLEGHGRQPFDAAIDLSRTVGWFTTRYPMVLPQVGADRLNDWLLALKQGLREIPEHGMSYGVLRYGGHDELRVEPEVSFNFVGELGQFGGREVSLLRLGAGRERGAAADRRHLLAFDGWQDGAGLWLSCRHAARHGEATVAGLLERIQGQVQRLAQACAAASAAVYTPADFTGMEFSQGELDQLMGELGDVDDER